MPLQLSSEWERVLSRRGTLVASLQPCCLLLWSADTSVSTGIWASPGESPITMDFIVAVWLTAGDFRSSFLYIFSVGITLGKTDQVSSKVPKDVNEDFPQLLHLMEVKLMR